MDKGDVTVSVIVTTYNQESYIQQALEGIINQKVSFLYEILVGDDCSTDQTNEILSQMQLKYPNLIKVIRNKRNLGERKNTCKLLKQCKGNYIAVCEGDDYWIDDTKLEKQIDFLEKNPEYIGTAHNVLCVDTKGRKLGKKKIDFPYQKEHIYGRENALRYEEIGQMSSYVYRNIWKNMSTYNFELFRKCNANTDVKLNVTLGLLGNVYYFENVWSCRRRSFQGTGWTAYIVNNNAWDKAYSYCINIKEYVKKRFNENLQVDEFLLNIRYEAIKYFLKNPSFQNLKVIQRIYCKKGESIWKMTFDIMRIGIWRMICHERALEYERIFQNIKKYGYCSPVNYWIAEKGDCIYVQNPKVACSSIKAAMYHLGDGVKDYEEIHNILLERACKLRRGQKLQKDFPDIFKFTFVRNPYERVVSCYVNKFILDKEKGKDNYFKEYFIKSIQKVKNFNEFVYRIFFISDKMADWHFRSQSCITHDTRRHARVDHIGKYENLNEEFNEIASRYQFSQLSWFNKSYDYNWRDFYTLRTAILIYLRYYRDFDLYGYHQEFIKLIKYIIKKRVKNI